MMQPLANFLDKNLQKLLEVYKQKFIQFEQMLLQFQSFHLSSGCRKETKTYIKMIVRLLIKINTTNH